MRSTDPGSWAFLEAEGFAGFRTVGQLQADRCEEVPNEPGVYAVLRESLDPPEFLAASSAPFFRGMDPSRPIDELRERWISGTQVLYLGRACGPGVRSLLKQRVKRYLRFGHGRVVAHWGGRSIWQLRDSPMLRMAWKATGDEDPQRVEARLQALFHARYGMPPFANQEHENDEAPEPEE